MNSRRASIILIYEGKNITDDIAADLQSFTYNDNASGTSDDITIELKDDQGKWISSWAPAKGDIIKPILFTENWNFEGEYQSLECGTYIVDEPSYSGRPRVLNIGAVSVPSFAGFMDVTHNHTWQNATVQSIIVPIIKSYTKNDDKNNVEDENKIEFKTVFQTQINPVICFVHQSEQTDAAFLFDLCQKNGLAMKLYNQKINIFSEKEYETHNPSITLTESDLISWTAKTSFANTGYDGCQIVYTLPNSETTFSHTFRPLSKTGNKIYQMNETVYDLAEAERYAQCKLRELNKKEYTLSLEIAGNL
ncbi:MAG TPA: hypothetical protein DDW50_11880, partial [Firmicutes bacterium]|nr:hypothetical protein [Bacillota bacterium]